MGHHEKGHGLGFGTEKRTRLQRQWREEAKGEFSKRNKKINDDTTKDANETMCMLVRKGLTDGRYPVNPYHRRSERTGPLKCSWLYVSKCKRSEGHRRASDTHTDIHAATGSKWSETARVFTTTKGCRDRKRCGREAETPLNAAITLQHRPLLVLICTMKYAMGQIFLASSPCYS